MPATARLLLSLAGLLLLVAGCEPSQPDGVYIDAKKISVGECFWRQHLDVREWSTVKLVPCDSGDWQFQVVDRLVLDGDRPYPGDDSIRAEATERCSGGWTTFLTTTRELWEAGWYDVLCLLERGAPIRGDSPGSA